jgi:hypothetical protein
MGEADGLDEAGGDLLEGERRSGLGRHAER